MRPVRFNRCSLLAWVALAVATLLCVSTGCALLTIVDGPIAHRVDKPIDNALPAMPRPKNAIQVDIIFVERPAGDPLLGAALWDEVDEIGPGTIESREMLARNGFRVGQVGSNPPRALASLFQMAQEVQSGKVGNSSRAFSHHRIVLPSEGETQIEVMSARPYFAPVIHNDKGDEPHEYTNARGILHMWAHREQDGWARLEFQPEIHYGFSRLRHVPDENEKELLLRQSQETDALYSQRFNLTLNIGEMAVISAIDQPPTTVGHGFFHETADGEQRHKLLVIRLSDMGQVQPIYSERNGVLRK